MSLVLLFFICVSVSQYHDLVVWSFALCSFDFLLLFCAHYRLDISANFRDCVVVQVCSGYCGFLWGGAFHAFTCLPCLRSSSSGSSVPPPIRFCSWCVSTCFCHEFSIITWGPVYDHPCLFLSLICLLFVLARSNIVFCTHAYPSVTICSHVCPYISSLCMIVFAEFSPVIGHHASYICPCVTMSVSPCRVFVSPSSFGPHHTHLTYLLPFIHDPPYTHVCMSHQVWFFLFLITSSKLKIVNIWVFH